MPTNWEDFEAIEEPDIDWNEFEPEPPFANLVGQRMNLPKAIQGIRESRVGPITFGKEESEYKLQPGAELKNIMESPVMPEIATPGIGVVGRFPKVKMPGIEYTPTEIPAMAQSPFEPVKPPESYSADAGVVTPLLNLVPDNPAFAPAVVAATSGSNVSPEEKLKRIQRLEGVANSLKETANFFTSPLGAATIGMGALPKLAQKAVAAAFAVDMGIQVPEIAKRLGEIMGMPPEERDQKEIASLITSAITTTGFTVAGALHSVAPAIEGTLPFIGGTRSGFVARPDVKALRVSLPEGQEVYAPSAFQRIQGAEITRGYPTLREIDKMVKRGGEAAPEKGAPVPGAILTTQPTPGMREIKPEEQKDAVTIFDEEASSPTGPLSNAITQKAGLSITKVSDFDRLLELKNQYEKDFSDAKQRYTELPKEQQTIKELEALTKLASRAQYAREVIETATNTGGWVEGGLTNIGERPLDWRKNPEAAEWLRKNGEKVGIELPDELKPKESAQPEVPAEGTVRVYHGEGGAEGAGLGGFSVSKDPVYAARFGPRQSFVDVPTSEFERMQKEAREKGEPTNLKLSEQYQKQLQPVEKPIEMPVEDLDKVISPAPEVPPPAKPPEAAVPPTAPPEPSAPVKPKLKKPKAKDLADRNQFVGEDYAGPPNSIVVQLRGLDTEPLGTGKLITLPFDGNLTNAGKALMEKIAPIIRNRGASWRESIFKATDANGNASHQFRINPTERTVSATTQAELEAARAEYRKRTSPIDVEATTESVEPKALPAPAEPKPVTPVVTEEPALIGQGPGAMTRRESSRPAPPEPAETIEATGLKNAIAEMERVSYGFGERSLPEKQAMAEAWQRAGRTIQENPEAGRELAQALMDNPRRGLTGDESALILRHKVALENAINNAAERSITGKGEAKIEAQAALDRHRAELSGLIDAIERRGTEWGREGRWRQALAYEDYSFATQERLLTASKGRPLTDTERTALQQQLADYREKLASFEKHNKERDQKLIDSAVKEALDKIEKQGTRVQYAPRVIEVAENFAKYMDRKAEDARARLAAKFSRTSAGIDPTILSDVIIIGTAKLARGAVDFAKWSDAMIKDLGPGVKDYLKSAWSEVGKTLDSELTSLEKTIGKSAVEKVRKVVKKSAPATPQEKVTDIAAKTAAKFKANDLSTVSPLVRKLARHFVETGVRGREAVIDAVHSALKTVLPDITRSDTMRMIAGYGEYRLLPKDDISVLLRGYKGEMQQIAKLEDMASGKAPEKTGVERRAPTDEERRLIKEVEEAKKKGGYTVTDPATQLRTAMDAVKTRLQNQIADLESQIAKREKIVKEPTKLQYDEEANRLKARRDELKREFDEIFPKEPITEVERLRRWKERTQNRIDDLNDMLRTGDINAPQKRAAVKLDSEGNRLQAILEEAKVNIQHARERAEWERMSIFQKAKRGAIDTYDAARLLMTTGEFSFILRQGKWTFLSRPLLTIKALPEMFQAMRGWRQAHEADLKVFNDPAYPASQAAKLHIVNESASLSKMEEIFAGRWAHAIPIISNFNRAARVFLNKIRFDTWKAMRKSLTRNGIPTPAEDAQIAMFVNESTGRGSLGFAEQAAIPLGRAFFAPRYVASRFQLLAGHSLWKGNARSRRIIATEYARALIGLGIYYSLLNAMFSGDKDKKPVTLDPRSSDFGKVVIGNTRIDPLAGLAQAATFIGRTVTGETKTQKGRVIPIRKVEGKKPRYGDPTWSDVAARFARSKMHPIPGAVANLFEGTSMDGAETTIAKETGNLMGPITYFDIYKALSEQDIPDATAMSLLALLGEGLQTYNTKK